MDLLQADVYQMISPFPYSKYLSFPKKGLQQGRNNGYTCVYVDSDRLIPARIHHYNDKGDKNTQFINTYPAYVVNLSDSLILDHRIEGEILYWYQEAKDEWGNWRKVDPITYWICGSGHLYEYLQPNEFYVAKIPVYEGSFETELRLVTPLGVSNIYKGSINPSQFIDEEDTKPLIHTPNP